MPKAKVIQLPKPEIFFECWNCECQAFFLHLDHSTPTIDIISGIECAECGFEVPFTNQAKEKPEKC